MRPEASVGPLVTYVTAASYLCHSTTAIHFWDIVFLSLSFPSSFVGRSGASPRFLFAGLAQLPVTFLGVIFFSPFRLLLFMI